MDAVGTSAGGDVEVELVATPHAVANTIKINTAIEILISEQQHHSTCADLPSKSPNFSVFSLRILSQILQDRLYSQSRTVTANKTESE
jgi:hypothetical protein